MKREITQEQFLMEIELQGMKDKKDVAFICPGCKTAQSYRSFEKLGIDKEKITGWLGFSCIGRQTCAGSPRKESDGKPCNWTLGGLFQIQDLTVILEDGKKVPHFEIASSPQAEALRVVNNSPSKM